MNPIAVLSVVVQAKGIRETNAGLMGTEAAGRKAAAGANAAAAANRKLSGGTGAVVGGVKKVATGLGLTGVAAAGLGIQFDDSMNKIVSLVGLSRGEVDGMKKSVLGLAGETGKSPRELADALYFLTSAGLTGKQSLSALEVSAKASAAGLGDMTAIADAVSSAMNAYGAKTMSAAHATDVLIATAKAGKAEPEELAKTMGRVLPIASQLGVTFEDVGGAVASMSLKGLDAAESVTAVRQMLQALIKPTVQGRKVLSKYGLSLQGVQRSLKEKGLLATLLMLRKRFHGNTQDLAKLFAGVEGFNGVLSLTAGKGRQAAGVFKDVQGNAGSTDKAFAAAKDSAFRLRQGIQYVTVALIQVGAVLGDVVSFFAQHRAALTALLVVLASASAGYVAFRVATLASMAATGGLTGAMIALRAAMLANPIVAIVTILAALAAALVVAYQRSETFRNIVNAAFGAVRAAVEFTVGFVADHWKLIVGLILGPVALILAAVITYWDQIVSVISGAWDVVRSVTSAVWGAIKAYLEALWTVLSTIAVARFNVMKAIVLAVWTAVRTATSATWTAIKAVVSAVLTAIKAVVTTYFNAYKTVILAVWTAISAATSAAWSAIKAVLSAAWSAIRAAASAAWAGIKAAIVNPITNAVQFVRDKISDLAGIIRSALGAAKAAASAAAGGIISALTSPFRTAVAVIEGIVNRIADLAHKASSIAGKVKGLPGKVGGKIGGLVGKIGGAFASGTLSAPSGWALVGEQGPELVRMRGGERVFPHDDSMSMLGGGGGVTVNHYGDVVLNDSADQDAWAHKLAWLVETA